MSKRGTSSPSTEKVFLTGFMGVGKTTVGRLIAEARGVPFVDTDHLIEEQVGTSVARIFAEQGETAFRKFERDVVSKLAAESAGRIVGLGGGAIVDPENQRVILGAGKLVWLRACPETILERCLLEPGQRPLLEGGTQGEKLKRIIHLLQERQQFYGVAQIRVLTDGKNPRDVAAEVIGLLK